MDQAEQGELDRMVAPIDEPKLARAEASPRIVALHCQSGRQPTSLAHRDTTPACWSRRTAAGNSWHGRADTSRRS